MITEKARVISVSEGILWVEAVQQSACSGCSAREGCGQRLLARFSGKTAYLKVLIENQKADDYASGEIVEIGLPEDVVVRGSLLIYLLPIVSMLVFACVGHFILQNDLNASGSQLFFQELGVVLFAGIGLCLGAWFVRGTTACKSFAKASQPQLIRKIDSQPDWNKRV